MTDPASDDRLLNALVVDQRLLQQLHTKLVQQADQHSLLDISYRTIDTPLGRLLLAATPVGLVRVAFAVENFDTVLQNLAGQLSPRLLETPRRLDEPAREIDQYLAGRRHSFDLPLDRSLSRGFRGAVHQHLSTVPYGQTATYKDIAVQLDNPNAVRAVGTACATNPLPIVVPCHRILRSDGTLGGYVGGLPAKTTLLSLEQAQPPS